MWTLLPTARSLRTAAIPLIGTLPFVVAVNSATAGCPPTPRPQEQCQSFQRTSLTIEASGRFDWRAWQGPGTDPASFVDPEASYQLCAWDQEHLVVAADIPGNADCEERTCWSPRGVSEWRYFDECGANGDIRLFDISATEATATKLRALTMVVGGIILPVTDGIIVQIVRNDTGTCMESFIPAEGFTVDDKAAFAGSFDADAPPLPWSD